MRRPTPLLPALLVAVLMVVLQACDDGGQEVLALGDVDHGRELFVGYGCGACHQVGGIRQARGRVGPDLDGLADQRMIAGSLPNTPEQLAAFIQNPQQHAPGTGMPDVGVTPDDAEDLVAFLLDQG
ncbi:c-type cytochrome [Egicoccus halophilus]|uniref:Cytochrome c domain-containing protein n=1 Tax=Egicoccus halophilus TaxID=1670830 RepID=A0A8J3A512_9ACTN|nr:c-type cytochrome [Egicoccus halophilus]GGI03019.1 hypothetical protein GCM10011354_02340 [Egicoccus halophilus]